MRRKRLEVITTIGKKVLMFTDTKGVKHYGMVRVYQCRHCGAIKELLQGLPENLSEDRKRAFGLDKKKRDHRQACKGVCITVTDHDEITFSLPSARAHSFKPYPK